MQFGGESMFQQDRSLSVSELNEYVRRLMAGDVLLRSLEVTGEISGYKHHISGHRYFSLKDAQARVQCVMFRQNAMGLDFQPQDGMRVKLRASASLYPRDGSYQLYVSSMEKCGMGELYLRFEALKKKLGAEGLFDPAVKRPLPMLPKYIGIATSRAGAALRDMVRIARRRNPNVGVILAPCAVQGADAAGEIVQAIRALNLDGRAEVILAGRGGGSIEDLWAFNEEIVARAIAQSRIPVVSCVGHETDFTIADFVADVRAATPSMAAEIAVPVAAELRRGLDSEMRRVSAGLMQANRLRRAELKRICTLGPFRDPVEYLIRMRREEMEGCWERCLSAQTDALVALRGRLERATAKLDALNPAGVLDRGYAYIASEGRVLSGVSELSAGMRVEIRMRDGGARAEILDRDAVEEENGREETEL